VLGSEVAVVTLGSVGDAAASEVGEEASAVGEGAGGSVGAFTCPVQPTKMNMIISSVDIAQFER
jgi:hypothetical protein